MNLHGAQSLVAVNCRLVAHHTESMIMQRQAKCDGITEGTVLQ